MDKQKTCLSVGIFSFSYSLSLIPFSVASFVLFLWKIIPQAMSNGCLLAVTYL